MAQADVDLVTRIYEEFGARRFPGELFAEEIEWKTWDELPDAGTYRGIREVRRFFADWVAGWAEVRNEVERLIDTGDRIVALVHGSFRLEEESKPFENHYAHVWTIRDGRATRVEAVGRAEALRLVGEA